MVSLQIDPRGMFYSLTIVVSFHPLIITKVDQAFHVKCFFEEANRGLTAELGIRLARNLLSRFVVRVKDCSRSVAVASL